MTNVRSGTWMLAGNCVMHNGTNIIDEYTTDMDHLKVRSHSKCYPLSPIERKLCWYLYNFIVLGCTWKVCSH